MTTQDETPTPAPASDWRVSVTPSPHGDWQLPGGLRYNATFHDGATVADFEALLATLNAIAPLLTSAYDTPYIPQGATHPPINSGSSTPPPPRQQAPQAATGDGEDVYGVGIIQEGGQFDVKIERATRTSTSKGKPQVALFRPGNQYPFAHANENQFDVFKALTGVDANAMNGEAKFQTPILMRFKVGKKKANSDKHYIDFVGGPAPMYDCAAALGKLAAKYEGRWTSAQIAASLDKLDTSNMTTDQAVDAFSAKVDPDPKATA